jgi:hypothetical protein
LFIRNFFDHKPLQIPVSKLNIPIWVTDFPFKWLSDSDVQEGDCFSNDKKVLASMKLAAKRGLE